VSLHLHQTWPAPSRRAFLRNPGSATAGAHHHQFHLCIADHCDRALFVKNLRYLDPIPSCRLASPGRVAVTNPSSISSYNVSPEELFDLFGKFGPIRYASINDIPSLVTQPLTFFAARSDRASRTTPRARPSWSMRT
jgi:RNA recognition motif-containing protein